MTVRVFLSVQSHFQKHRIKSSGPRNDGQRPGDHPLKTRVNALMKHRMSRPSVSPSNTKVRKGLVSVVLKCLNVKSS